MLLLYRKNFFPSGSQLGPQPEITRRAFQSAKAVSHPRKQLWLTGLGGRVPQRFRCVAEAEKRLSPRAAWPTMPLRRHVGPPVARKQPFWRGDSQPLGSLLPPGGTRWDNHRLIWTAAEASEACCRHPCGDQQTDVAIHCGQQRPLPPPTPRTRGQHLHTRLLQTQARLLHRHALRHWPRSGPELLLP